MLSHMYVAASFNRGGVGMKEAIHIQEARQFLAERSRKRTEYLDERFRVASKDFQHMIAHIIRNYHPERIWQCNLSARCRAAMGSSGSRAPIKRKASVGRTSLRNVL